MEKTSAFEAYQEWLQKEAGPLTSASKGLFKLLRRGGTKWRKMRGPGGSRTLNLMNVLTQGNKGALQNALHFISKQPSAPKMKRLFR